MTLFDRICESIAMFCYVSLMCMGVIACLMFWYLLVHQAIEVLR